MKLYLHPTAAGLASGPISAAQNRIGSRHFPEPFTTIHDEEQALAPDAKARQVTLI